MNRIKTYFLATRPMFFPGIMVPVILGAASAWYAAGEFDPLVFALAMAAAVLYHGGMNVFNDYFDSINGTDGVNRKALPPFTGGSRFIQKGLLTRKQTLGLAITLTAAGSAIGILLAWLTTPLLLLLGAVGLLSGFFYSAPPLFLAARGLGELTVGVNFGLLTVLGSYVAQTGRVDAGAVVASLPVSFLITALLYINEFPDYEADRTTGKRTLVVRLGPARARWGLVAMVAGAYLSVIGGAAAGLLPLVSLAVLATLPLAVPGVAGLLRHYRGGRELIPSIKSIVLAHLATGLILSAAHIIRP